MLAKGPKNPGGEAMKRKSTGNIVLRVETSTLADLGIERMQSHRWQKIAKLPVKAFERPVGAKGPHRGD